jgi:hypothetical protein
MNIIAFGFWPAIPFFGWILTKIFSKSISFDLSKKSRLISLMIYIIIGISVISPLLLLSMILGVFNGNVNGIIGWFILLVTLLINNRKKIFIKSWHLSFSNLKTISIMDVLFILCLFFMVIIYLGYPHESIFGGRDQGIYSNSAVFIAKTGGLYVDFPVFSSNEYKSFLPGLNKLGETISVQFSHLFSVWLAQAFFTFGKYGLFGMNAIFGIVSVILFRLLLSEYVEKNYSIIGSLLLGFNVGEIWHSRLTLTEVFTQIMILSSLLFLLWSFKKNEYAWAGWAGFTLGVAVLCRIDSILLIPLLTCSCLIFALITGEMHRKKWDRFFITFLPVCVLAIAYYYFCSYLYFLDLLPRIVSMLILTFLLIFLFLLLRRKISKFTDKWFRMFFYTLLCAVTVLFVFAHLVRPHLDPYVLYNLPGTGLDQTRTYQEESLSVLIKYLSVPVAYCGLIGWIMALKKVLLDKEIDWVVPLVVIGGFSVLYIYNPNISPDQYWAIRRFVPIIIPGFIMLFVYSMQHIILILKKKTTYALYLVITILFSLVILSNYVYNITPIAFYHEQDGTWDNIETIAKEIPKDGIVLSDVGPIYETPLLMSFLKNIVPLSSLNEESKNNLFEIVNQEKAIFYLSNSAKLQNQGPIKGTSTRFIKKFELKTSWTQRIPAELPREKHEQTDIIYLYKVEPNLENTNENTHTIPLPFFSTQNGVYENSASVIVSDGTAKYLIYGPYLLLEKGNYKITANLDLLSLTDGEVGYFEAVSGNVVLNKKMLVSDLFVEDSSTNVHLSIHLKDRIDNIEFRIFTNEGTLLRVNSVLISDESGEK